MRKLFCVKRRDFAYLFDWLVVVLIFSTSFWIADIDAYERIVIPDESIQYPHKDHEVILFEWLMLYGLFGPMVIIMLYLWLYKKSSGKQIYITVLGLFLAVSLTFFVTNFTKVHLCVCLVLVYYFLPL